MSDEGRGKSTQGGGGGAGGGGGDGGSASGGGGGSGDARLREKLLGLRDLMRDGLIPEDIYKSHVDRLVAVQLWGKAGAPVPSSYASPTSPQHSWSDTRTATPATGGAATISVCAEVAPFIGSLLGLLLGIVTLLILWDWAVGIDTPRVFDFVMHPASTVSTLRTGR